MTGVDPLSQLSRLEALLEERAAGYGSLRKSSLTAIALDRAIDTLRTQASDLERMRGENERLYDAVQHLRDGYADAASGLAYVLREHGRLPGVGFDRVEDRFFELVTMPEREGLLAGSRDLPARSTLSGGETGRG